MSTTPTIPLNDEHKEAFILEQQIKVNAQRAEMKAKMTPTEVARLEVIEECSAKLEAAEVPFQLWASSADDVKARGWWCFHRLSYIPKSEPTAHENGVFDAWITLLPQLLNHQTTHGAITIMVYDYKTGRAKSVHSHGECQFLPPPPPPPPEVMSPTS